MGKHSRELGRVVVLLHKVEQFHVQFLPKRADPERTLETIGILPSRESRNSDLFQLFVIILLHTTVNDSGHSRGARKAQPLAHMPLAISSEMQVVFFFRIEACKRISHSWVSCNCNYDDFKRGTKLRCSCRVNAKNNQSLEDSTARTRQVSLDS